MVKIVKKGSKTNFTEEQIAFLNGDEEFGSVADVAVEFKKRFTHFKNGKSVSDTHNYLLASNIRAFFKRNKQI